ncbi:MAG: DUF4304 domain-containing protein [Deltaproteobacteria bacterium]|nr:DUF4304 domain-containing protein [Deltaproteobacteria bacterium]
MAATPAQQALDAVIARAITPALKPLGYRKTGRTFRCTAARAVRVVNVQASRSSTAQRLTFAINLGVYYPEVGALGESLYRFSPGPAGPGEADCQLRQRLGALCTGRDDLWWEVIAGTELDPVTAAVADALRTHGLPWLDARGDFEAGRREAGREEGVAAILFALVAGDRDLARALATALVARSPRATAVASWARAQGLLV